MRPKAMLQRLRTISWTIKIIPKLRKEISVLHFNALDVLRLSFVACSVFLVVFSYIVQRGSEERASVQVLSKNLQFKDAELKTVENQKVEMENLLSQKAGELENHLTQMRLQEEELRKLLQGKHQTGFLTGKRVAVESTPVNPRLRFAEKSSRGGSYDQVIGRLFSLERHIETEQTALNHVKEIAMIRYEALQKEKKKLAAMFDRIPSLWPVPGEITSGFGYRFHPIDGEGEFHRGVDIATGYASPIKAAASGTCAFADYKNGFGYTVLIDHGHGLATQYSHCSRLLIHPGALVKKGEVIALVGSTGYSTGPHVHFEVHYNDAPVNPTGFLGLTVDELADRGGIQSFVSKR